MPSNLNFDATQVAPSTGFELVAPGKHRAHITNSSMKPTKNDANNEYLELEWTILDGPERGRKLWKNLNVKHSGATTMEIALRELSAICHHLGKTKVGSSGDLHHIPCFITVLHKPDRNNASVIRAEIVAYEPDPSVRSVPLPKHGSTTFGQGAAQQVQQGAPPQPGRPGAPPAMGPAWGAPRNA